MTQEIERHYIKVAALGRRFQLGDLYNHRNDRIVAGNQEHLASATQTANQFQLVLMNSGSSASKWELMGLDEHLQASVVAGLIEKYRGASNYVNDHLDPTQATSTLRCLIQSKKESLNLVSLLENEVPFLLKNEEIKKSEATHIVVGVVYGAEAYCVLTQEHNEDQDEAKENLSILSKKLEMALEGGLTLSDFTEQFEKGELKELNRMKCRLYADLQSQTVRECGFLDLYKNCIKLIEQVQTTDKAVPIAAVLCPLKVILIPAGGWPPFEYRDVDGDLVTRCCNILDELDQVGVKVEAIRKKNKNVIRNALRQFGKPVTKYKELVKNTLKNAVVKARGMVEEDDTEIEKIADIIENHPLFKPSQLQLWLTFKEAESEMAGKMAGLTDVLFLADQKSLEKELADSFDNKYALVLNIPPLDEKTEEILEVMRNFVEDYTKLVSVDDDDVDMDDDQNDQVNEDKLPWHMIPRKKKQVLEKNPGIHPSYREK